ncbi:polysaccharide export protein [Kaistia defluvii]|uniref:polysaccharide biosynthesis/export family protein n=1 Tax=Kaistia defluvii TaxID=410841 RepID=UPI00224F9719|nr:polysaccharide biosynthesis/export family protein [Kaistia defluvii]MCX5519529.1 polysaccharide export protein [Kaistia defluvii]
MGLAYQSLRRCTARLLQATVLLCALGVAVFGQEVYRFGVGDVLQVSVFGQPDLSGRFAIGSDGAIRYPRLGRVMMLGLMPEEASQRIAEGLAGRIPADHTVTIDVLSHAPVFVTGDVQTPGRYEYRPGMIVLELVALGGGLRRPASPVTGAALQLLTLRQDSADQKLIRWSQRIERIRLEAEIRGVAFDGRDLLAADAPADMVAAEVALYKVRTDALAAQAEAADAQRRTLDQEIAALQESLRLHDRDLELIQQDVSATQQLADQGLTAHSRLRDSQRQQSALKRDRLEVIGFLARARQNRLDVDQRAAAFLEARAAENAAALRAAELAIVRTEQRIASLAASMEAASDDLETGSLRQIPAATYAVVRSTNAGANQIAVGEHDRLRPGDILEVDRHLAEPDMAARAAIR